MYQSIQWYLIVYLLTLSDLKIHLLFYFKDTNSALEFR